jgi:hypothetical protein
MKSQSNVPEDYFSQCEKRIMGLNKRHIGTATTAPTKKGLS